MSLFARKAEPSGFQISCFAVLLPVGELLIWLAIVVIPTLNLYAKLQALHSRGEPLAFGSFQVKVPQPRQLTFSLDMISAERYRTIVNINLPGSLAGAAITVPAIAYLRKHPGIIWVETWNAVTAPFFCLPIWWLLGRSLDLFLTTRRLQPIMLWTGSILGCASIALGIGIITAPLGDQKDLAPFLPGAIFWAVAFGFFPVVWLVRRLGASLQV